MRIPPQAATLPDGRLHLQHGPIDLVIGASGEPAAIRTAYAAAAARFATILDELCGELDLLRMPASPSAARFAGVVATRMAAAVAPFEAATFITPMAAVAGSVADEVLAAMTTAAPLARAYVNNGGDIALHLAPGASFRIGLVDRPDLAPGLFGTTAIQHADPVRGIATSGWRGRSFSLGIADAVTVLAADAAAADAAATIIANAVDLAGHPAIGRVRACDLQPESDLRERLVTREVGDLSANEIDAALAAGLVMAERLRDRALIAGAALHLQGETRTLDHARRASSPRGGEGWGEGDAPSPDRALPPHPLPGRCPGVNLSPSGRGISAELSR